jgi:hypothetical protein
LSEFAIVACGEWNRFGYGIRSSLTPRHGWGLARRNYQCQCASRHHGHDGGANKTGTLSGVGTLAGYADTSRHGRVPQQGA